MAYQFLSLSIFLQLLVYFSNTGVTPLANAILILVNNTPSTHTHTRSINKSLSLSWKSLFNLSALGDTRWYSVNSTSVHHCSIRLYLWSQHRLYFFSVRSKYISYFIDFSRGVSSIAGVLSLRIVNSILFSRFSIELNLPHRFFMVSVCDLDGFYLFWGFPFYKGLSINIFYRDYSADKVSADKNMAVNWPQSCLYCSLAFSHSRKMIVFLKILKVFI